MRLAVLGLMACALMGCGRAEKKRDAADAKAAASGFTPPTVTTRVDWGSRAERRFQKLDRDQSGSLEQNEWPRTGGRMASYDVNGDKIVTDDEFGRGAIQRFDRMDLNKDGTVTSEEQQTTRGGTIPVS